MQGSWDLLIGCDGVTPTHPETVAHHHTYGHVSPQRTRVVDAATNRGMADELVSGPTDDSGVLRVRRRLFITILYIYLHGSKLQSQLLLNPLFALVLFLL